MAIEQESVRTLLLVIGKTLGLTPSNCSLIHKFHLFVLYVKLLVLAVYCTFFFFCSTVIIYVQLTTCVRWS